MIKIGIDGLSGSGKGALASAVAKHFNLKHLDTGAIFRGIGCGFIELGFTDLTDEIINTYLHTLKVEVKFEGDTQKIFLNDEDITHLLRTELGSQMASKVSVFPKVREKYLEIVRDFSNNYDCIIDGRDITSVVLPDADVKIYLCADEEVRAERRYKENVAKNIPCTYEEVLANLQERDHRDTHRDVAPLIKVKDAIELDNTELNIEQTVAKGVDIITQILKEKGKI